MVHFRGRSFSIRVVQVYAPITNGTNVETEWVNEDLQNLLELTPKKDVPFIIGDWNAKVGSQEISGETVKFGLGVQNEAGKRLTGFLPREQNCRSKHPLPTTQKTTPYTDITRCSILKSD